MARPRIICHMTSSVDGKLHPKRWTPPASGVDAEVLRAHYDEIAGRLDADGWIVGRKTMSYYAKGAPALAAISRAEAEPVTPPEHNIGDRRGRALAIGVDRGGKLAYESDDADGDHIVAILAEEVDATYLGELRDRGISYFFAGPHGDDLAVALDQIGKAFGADTLLLEGGAIMNGAFLKAGLIDEISLLIYPGIDGLAGVAGIFEASGHRDDLPAAGQALRHISTETLDGGTVWLRYNVESAP
jgi:riboflavin biosynthesis pyrimidine reductase